MDLNIAIAHINPEAQYRLTQAVPPHDIIDWRGPGPQPTQVELEAAYADEIEGKALASQKLRLNADLHTYLDAVSLDEGTQSSFLAYETQFQKVLLAGGTLTTTQEQVRGLIQDAWDFTQAVMGYYYTEKAGLEQAADPNSVTWDFSTMDAQNPGVTLRQIAGVLNG